MNTINFSNSFKQYPLATEDLIFLQEMINSVSGLAKLAGSGNYILSGCENTSGTTYSPGLMIIAGEVLPFQGGVLQSTVRVKEVRYDKEADYNVYVGARITRYAAFGSNVGNTETYTWADFIKLLSIEELQTNYATKVELEALESLVMPRGGIIMWSGSVETLPTGFHLCNGDSVEDYGTVPDLRGRFVVGYDDTAASTPPNVFDGKELNYSKIGNRGGKPTVVLTKDNLPNFKLGIEISGGYSAGVEWSDPDYASATKQYANGTNNASKVRQRGYTESIGSDLSIENRPPYYVLAYIIKVV